MRRVDCRRGDGKRTLTKAYMLFLARWARRLSWKETAEAFRTSWDKVFDAVEHVVAWGLAHRVLGPIDAIGVDEIQYAKRHKYLTLVDSILERSRPHLFVTATPGRKSLWQTAWTRKRTF